MIVEIAGPVFKCEEDETVFLSRLREVSGYVSVAGKGAKLYLTLADTPEPRVTEQLQGICNFWNTTFKVAG